VKIASLAVLIGFALVGMFAVGLFVFAHFQHPSSHFKTYEDLRDSGLIDKGWVPEYLPRSATDIEELHDIDTNQAWASFKYRAGDTAAADKGCQVLHQTNEGRKYLCPPFERQTAILVLNTDGTGYVSTHADEM